MATESLNSDVPPPSLPFGHPTNVQINDPKVASDAVFGVKTSLIETYQKVDAADPDAAKVGFKGGEWLLERDFVLCRQ